MNLRRKKRALEAAEAAPALSEDVECIEVPSMGDRSIDVSSLASIDQLGRTCVVTVTARDLSGASARALIDSLLERDESGGAQHFVFDFQSVELVDSSCIGAMVEMLTRIQPEGRRIAVVSPNQHIAYLLRLTKLDRLFPICRDVMAAIQAVESPPTPSGAKKRR